VIVYLAGKACEEHNTYEGAVIWQAKPAIEHNACEGKACEGKACEE
jgi:hypothetical protein